MVDFGCLYERLAPNEPLAADDPTYIDWQTSLGLVDVKQQLKNSVLLTRHGYSQRLFTGQRGGGKTTELRRLQVMLTNRPAGERYFVGFLDADDTLDLDDADPTDLVVAIVRQLVTDLAVAGIAIRPGKRLTEFVTAAQEILNSIPDAGIDVKAGDPWGIVELSTTLKRRPSIRREVRRLLEGRLPTLYDAVNEELLPTVRSQLATRGYCGLLLIVDQLDRISNDGDRHRAVFWEGRGKLRALDIHLVYTTPIEYAYSRALPTLENEYGELLGLPLLPITASVDSVRDTARQLTADVALRRLRACGTTELELFESEEIRRDIVHLSGGHLRSLFFLMRTAIESSGLIAPLTATHVEQVTRRLAAKYLDPLEQPEREIVRLVHDTKAKPPDEAGLERFYGLLRDQYVFSYAVGDQRWYDWNPLLERSALATP